MFSRLIDQFSRLTEFNRLDLLRKMVEGSITYEKVLTYGDRLSEIRKHTDMAKEFSDLVDNFSARVHSINTPDEALKLIDAYDGLSIQQRLENKEKYEVSLLRCVKREHPIFHRFDALHQNDISVAMAFVLLIGVSARELFETGGTSPDKKIQAMKCLHPSNHGNTKQVDANLVDTVHRFIKLYNILIHSYITDDKKNYIIGMTGRLVTLELENRFGFIHTIQFLLRLKNKLNANEIKEAKFLMFGSKIPEGVLTLKGYLRDLPTSMNILSCDDELLKIKSIYAEIKETVVAQKKKLNFTSNKDVAKFYNGLIEEMDVVDKEEGEHIRKIGVAVSKT